MYGCAIYNSLIYAPSTYFGTAKRLVLSPRASASAD
jgi:hypothetical protein